MTPEQAKKIKSLRIENQVIDDDFHDFFLSVRELNCLYFAKCIVDCVTLFDVEQVPVLGVVNCNLTSDLAKEVLEDITNWDYIKLWIYPIIGLIQILRNFNYKTFGCRNRNSIQFGTFL